MPILALGVSYRRAPIELLERLAFGHEDDPKAYRRLLEPEAVSEGVILSTCNRVEVYANVATYHSGFQELKRFLAESRDVQTEEFAEPLYSHYEAHAAEHLFSVAAGIDSVVLGEPQILSQVRQAFRRASDERAAGPMLSALVRGAIRTGRRARAETAISASPAGVVTAGLDLAEAVVGPLAGRAAAVIGAGGMASLALDALRRRQAGPIEVLNRTPSRAASLARRTGAEPAGLDRLAAALARADLVVSSTAATGTVVGTEAVAEALRHREPGRPLFLLDLALPRDVDAGAANLPEVTVADLDDLVEHLDGGRSFHEADVAAVRRIVAEEVERFESWRAAARLAPLIQALRARGEAAVAAELQRLGPRLSALSGRDRDTAVALARGAV